jgi:hypothetical protein
MVLVVTHQISVRLRYVLHEIFEANHRIVVNIVNTEDFFSWNQLPDTLSDLESIIYYRPHRDVISNQESSIFEHARDIGFTGTTLEILGVGLLEKTCMDERWRDPGFAEITVNTKFGFENRWTSTLPILFPVSDSTLQFDPFSMVFWILSRYEEYIWWADVLRNKKQQTTNTLTLAHRFSGSTSHAFQHKYLNKPIVDWVRQYLFELIGINNEREIALRKAGYKVIPTADIDMVFKFGNRPFFRNLGSWIHSFKNPGILFERLLSIYTKNDPYNPIFTVAPILDMHEYSKCFLLMSSKHDAFHKQNPLEYSAVKDVFRKFVSILGVNKIGIHPSIAAITANSKAEIISDWQDEISILKSTIIDNLKTKTARGADSKKPDPEEDKNEVDPLTPKLENAHPYCSRFHYLYFQFPFHYESLLSLGISEDWSMGFHDQIGFRASTSFSFNWFNLGVNETTTLRVIPFQAMDVTCKNYLNISNYISIKYIDLLKQTIECVGGNFIFVFHNESVSESRPWKGWKNTILAWAKI